MLLLFSKFIQAPIIENQEIRSAYVSHQFLRAPWKPLRTRGSDSKLYRRVFWTKAEIIIERKIWFLIKNGIYTWGCLKQGLNNNYFIKRFSGQNDERIKWSEIFTKIEKAYPQRLLARFSALVLSTMWASPFLSSPLHASTTSKGGVLNLGMSGWWQVIRWIHESMLTPWDGINWAEYDPLK